MLAAVSAAIRSRGLIPPGCHVLVGFSGGCDSTALLYLLAALRGPLDFTLSAGHLNHGLRGAESEADETFVRDRCRELDVPLVVERIHLSQSREAGHSLEMAARFARHAFFRRALERTGADRVALAHTRSDQAETVLMRAIRGAGSAGLGAMRWSSEVGGLLLIRPLLGHSRGELEAYLVGKQQGWCEDASNRDPAMLRNRIRHELMPLLRRDYNPQVEDALARLAELLGEESAWLDDLAENHLAACLTGREDRVIDIARLRMLPLAAQRRVLHRFLVQRGLSPEQIDLLAIETGIGLTNRTQGTQQVDLGDGWRWVRRYAGLSVERKGGGGAEKPGPVRLNVPGATSLPAWGLEAEVERSEGFEAHPRGKAGTWPAEAWLDAAWVGRAALKVRAWRPGDRIAPPGMRGTRKIHDILVDAKLPLPERPFYPVVECRGQIVWAPGFSVDRRALVKGLASPSLRVKLRPCS